MLHRLALQWPVTGVSGLTGQIVRAGQDVVLILLAPAWDELRRPTQPAAMMIARLSHARFDMKSPFPCLGAGADPGRRVGRARVRYGIS